jgi:hypothetical protein
MAAGPASSVRAARISAGSMYFTPAIAFASTTQKHA